MSGEQMRVVYQCLACKADFETKERLLEHLSAWDRKKEGCMLGKAINIRVVT